MEKQATHLLSEIETGETPSSWLGIRLIQVAGGDPAFADRLREMLWQAYCDANCPFGSTDKGMMIWWAHMQETTLQ